MKIFLDSSLLFLLLVTDPVAVYTYVFPHFLTNKHVRSLPNADTPNPDIPRHHAIQKHWFSRMISHTQQKLMLTPRPALRASPRPLPPWACSRTPALHSAPGIHQCREPTKISALGRWHSAAASTEMHRQGPSDPRTQTHSHMCTCSKKL